MAYTSRNKEKIAKLKANPQFIYDEYITNKKSTYTLASEWGLPSSTVYNLIKGIGAIGIKLSEKITSCDESKFNANDPIFCYLAGLSSADGYVDVKNHRVVLRLKNSDWNEMLNKLRDYFNVSNTVKVYTGSTGYSGEYEMADLTISSTVLVTELAKLNIIGRKSDLGVRFPDMSKLSDECQEMFFRGLIDGDGSIRKNCGGMSILEPSDDMMMAIQKFIFQKFGFSYDFLDSKEFKELYIWKKDANVIYKWMYRHNLKFKLEYKYNNATNLG